MVAILSANDGYFSTFRKNLSPAGIVSIADIPIRLQGRNMFISNYGAALQVCFLIYTVLITVVLHIACTYGAYNL